MKKSCEGCRALDDSSFHPRCGLGYSLTKEYIKATNHYVVRPLEECPKPKTLAKYCELHLSRQNNK